MRSRYDAFGNAIAQKESVANKYKFAGEQFDSNLGDYYLRQRYYNANSGRFTRQDTYEGRISEPLTLNKYIYAHDNPVMNVDPSGLLAMSTILEGLKALTILAAISAPFVFVPGLLASRFSRHEEPKDAKGERVTFLREKDVEDRGAH